jgi:hypothetical protein
VELADALRAALADRPKPKPAPPPVVVAPPAPEPEAEEPAKRSRKRLVLAAIVFAAAAVAAGVILVRGGGGGHTPTAPPPPAPSIRSRVATRFERLVPLQESLTNRILGAGAASGSTGRIQAAAAALADEVGNTEGWTSTLHPRTPADRGLVAAFTRALVAQAAYAASLANLSPSTTISTAQANDTVAKAQVAEQAYAGLAATAPELPQMPLKASDAERLVPKAAPAAPPSVLYDIVANTGGEGVRYRTSPSFWCGSAPPTDPCWNSVVPGGGAADGTRLRIYCYTEGASVHGETWWAKVGEGPDLYIPATFLQQGHAGRPAAAASC